jgi:hypothetical protein
MRDEKLLLVCNLLYSCVTSHLSFFTGRKVSDFIAKRRDKQIWFGQFIHSKSNARSSLMATVRILNGVLVSEVMLSILSRSKGFIFHEIIY